MAALLKQLRSEVLGGLRFFVDRSRLRVRDAAGAILLSDEEAAEQEARAAQETARLNRIWRQPRSGSPGRSAELRRLKAKYAHHRFQGRSLQPVSLQMSEWGERYSQRSEEKKR